MGRTLALGPKLGTLVALCCLPASGGRVLSELENQIPILEKIIYSAPKESRPGFLKTYQALCEKGETAEGGEKADGKSRCLYCHVLAVFFSERAKGPKVTDLIEAAFGFNPVQEAQRSKTESERYIALGQQLAFDLCSNKSRKEARWYCDLYLEFSERLEKNTEARNHLKSKCLEGNVSVCQASAEIFEALGDEATARSMLQKSCDLGEKLSCLRGLSFVPDKPEPAPKESPAPPAPQNRPESDSGNSLAPHS